MTARWAPDNSSGEHPYVVTRTTHSVGRGARTTTAVVYAANLRAAKAQAEDSFSKGLMSTLKVRRARAEDRRVTVGDLDRSESVFHIGKTGRADWEAQRAAARAHLIRIARRVKASDTALRDALQALDLEDAS